MLHVVMRKIVKIAHCLPISLKVKMTLYDFQLFDTVTDRNVDLSRSRPFHK